MLDFVHGVLTGWYAELTSKMTFQVSLFRASLISRLYNAHVNLSRKERWENINKNNDLPADKEWPDL